MKIPLDASLRHGQYVSLIEDQRLTELLFKAWRTSMSKLSFTFFARFFGSKSDASAEGHDAGTNASIRWRFTVPRKNSLRAADHPQEKHKEVWLAAIVFVLPQLKHAVPGPQRRTHSLPANLPSPTQAREKSRNSSEIQPELEKWICCFKTIQIVC